MFTVIRIMSCVIWSVIGLLFWIPLLTRTVVAFNVVTLIANVTRDGDAINRAHENLKFATTFYVMGFENICDWTDSDGASQVPVKYGGEYHPAFLFVLEAVWTTIWWGMLLNSVFY